MNFIEKKAILVVSFGTSHENTRAVTIDAIESEIASAFPGFAIYRAWTSGMIIRKILKRDHVKIFTVIEAMEQMRADGITDVIIQPTHVINGIENDLMKEHALSFRDAFRSIRFGTPLLTSEADNRAVIAAVTETFSSLSQKMLSYLWDMELHIIPMQSMLLWIINSKRWDIQISLSEQ